MSIYKPSHKDIQLASHYLSTKIKNLDIDLIIGVSRGGLVPANNISHMLNIPLVPISYSSKQGKGDNKNHDNVLPHCTDKKILIVDDIADSGYTLQELKDHYQTNNIVVTSALYYKNRTDSTIIPDFYWKEIPEDSPWIIFPWEHDDSMEYNIVNVISDTMTGKLKKADARIITERRDICKFCVVRNTTINVCTACGCFIPAKIRLQDSTCPMDLW